MPRIEVYVTEDQLSDIRQLSKLDGRSVSNYIKFCIAEKSRRTSKRDKDGKVIRFEV